jgi:group I intron endonuclease
MDLVVYCFTFPNGKKYIGKTQRGLEIRMRGHRHRAKYSQTYLYKAIRKYGWDQIKIDSLYTPDTISEMNEIERKLIMENETMDPAKGYNLREGGEGGSHSEETKQKISRSNSGDKNGMYGRSSWNAGKKLSAEHRRKLSESHMGHTPWNKGKKLPPTGPRTEEVKEKISKANSGENNGQSKLTWDIVNEIREKYSSGEYRQKDLAAEYGIRQSNISDIVNYKLWKRE